MVSKKIMESFLIFSVFVLFQTNFHIAATSSTISCPKIILESSDQENLTLSALPIKGVKDEKCPSRWRAKGFSAQKMEELLAKAPSMTAFPPELLASSHLPRNSSRIFHSSDDTARLTITVKEFKHGSIYLNFSYYVGLKSTNSTSPIKASIHLAKSGSEANDQRGTDEDITEKSGDSHHHRHRHHHRHKSNHDFVSAIATKAKHEHKKVKRNIMGSGRKKHEKLNQFTGGPNDNDESESGPRSEEFFAHEGGTKKVPYQLWKASLQRKYRPPGFYVSVNDEVIFDHWEGLWNKDFVIGKWTGSYTSRLTRGLWNHTEILINWENMPIQDVKISFEWEAMKENSFVALSDIVLSTTTDQTSCSEQFASTSTPKLSLTSAKSSVKEENNLAFLLAPSGKQFENETGHSQLSQMLIAKSGGAWKIFGISKVKSAETGGDMIRATLLREIENEKDIPKELMEELEKSKMIQSVTLIKKENGSMTTTSATAPTSSSSTVPTSKFLTIPTSTTIQAPSTGAVVTTSTESTQITTISNVANTTTTLPESVVSVKPVRRERERESSREQDGERTLVLCVGAVGLFVGLSIIRYKLQYEAKRARLANQNRAAQRV